MAMFWRQVDPDMYSDTYRIQIRIRIKGMHLRINTGNNFARSLHNLNVATKTSVIHNADVFYNSYLYRPFNQLVQRLFKINK